MNIKEVESKYRNYCYPVDSGDFSLYSQGFLKCHELYKPLVEVLKFIEEMDILPMAFAMEGGKEIRDALEECLLHYRKEILGEK